MLVLLLAFIQLSIGAAPEKAGPAPNPFKNDDSDAADPTLPYALIEGIDLFTVPLEELAKNERPATTLSEQCKQFLPHFHYYCRSSNIAKYNEEIRIICERYEAYCSDRVLPSINHIRRQIIGWKAAGIPVRGVRALEKCYTRCKETDPTCVNACECIHLQWVMDWQCSPGKVSAANVPNCQRWQAKCLLIWQPLLDLTPAAHRDYAPPPLVRGVFYGYDPIGTHTTFDRPRDHGVSFWRGTKTSLVNWPEGKLSHASTFEVPFLGLEGTWDQVNVGFPNLRTGMAQFTRDNADPLNAGTGRRSALAFLRRE
ncbi:dos-2 [Pristionchus pacificus]|nr:dos-2 [Pristionchus pacificus]